MGKISALLEGLMVLKVLANALLALALGSVCSVEWGPPGEQLKAAQ